MPRHPCYRCVCTVTFVYKRAVSVGTLSILADGDIIRAATLVAIDSHVCVGQAVIQWHGTIT